MSPARRPAVRPAGRLTYRRSGVDIRAGDEAVRRLAPWARATYRPEVLGDIGAFAGLYDATAPAAYGVCRRILGDPDVVVKTIGLGLASAILIDVLIVRMILAPAVMTLLGDRAWTLPAWLDRALPRISLEGEPTPAPAS